MKTEDLFKFGVTPKEGPRAGEKFEVSSIAKDVVFVHDSEGNRNKFEHGTYALWEPPKTLFDGDDIKPTWGNLKKAMEAKGLSDDTLFVTDLTTYDPFSLLAPNRRYGARFCVLKRVKDGEEEDDQIMVY